MIVKCPNCNKIVKWDKKNKFKPFCGKKCKIIDLNRWINEESYLL